MKKIQAIVLTLTGFLLLTTSCDDQKSYADYLKDESKAIDRFLIENEFSILERFPENGVFQSDELYLDPETGVYYNIINYGDTTRDIFFGEEIYIRFSGLKYFMTNDSTTYNNLDPNYNPYPEEIEFIGPVNSTTRSYYGTPGWVVPLTRIGHNGVVKMIVPFNMGSSYDRTNYTPTYYEHIEYRFEKSI